MECRLGATSKQRLQTLDSVHFYAWLPKNVRRLVFNRKRKSLQSRHTMKLCSVTAQLANKIVDECQDGPSSWRLNGTDQAEVVSPHASLTSGLRSVSCGGVCWSERVEDVTFMFRRSFFFIATTTKTAMAHATRRPTEAVTPAMTFVPLEESESLESGESASYWNARNTWSQFQELSAHHCWCKWICMCQFLSIQRRQNFIRDIGANENTIIESFIDQRWAWE